MVQLRALLALIFAHVKPPLLLPAMKDFLQKFILTRNFIEIVLERNFKRY